MTFSVDITVDRDVFEAIEDGARQLPGLMNTAYKRAVSALRSKVLRQLQSQPGSPRYPIRWTSAKQRRFVMRKLRLEGNIPYQRTGALVAAWKVEYIEEDGGGLWRASNSSDVEQFVTGIYQQAFHADTGWYQSQDVLADALVEAEEVLIQTWFTVTDELAGVG